MKNFSKKIASFIMILSMSLGIAGSLAVNRDNVVNAGTEVLSKVTSIGNTVVQMKADKATDSFPTGENGFGTDASAGRVWADKSVTIEGNDGFNIKLSALAQSLKAESSALPFNKSTGSMTFSDTIGSSMSADTGSLKVSYNGQEYSLSLAEDGKYKNEELKVTISKKDYYLYATISTSNVLSWSIPYAMVPKYEYKSGTWTAPSNGAIALSYSVKTTEENTLSATVYSNAYSTSDTSVKGAKTYASFAPKSTNPYYSDTTKVERVEKENNNTDTAAYVSNTKWYNTTTIRSYLGNNGVIKPQLRITQSVDKNAVVKDGTLTYTIRASNVSGGTLTDVKLSDVISDKLTITKAKGCTIDTATNTVSKTVESILNNKSSSAITIYTKLKADTEIGDEIKSVASIISYKSGETEISPEKQAARTASTVVGKEIKVHYEYASGHYNPDPDKKSLPETEIIASGYTYTAKKISTVPGYYITWYTDPECENEYVNGTPLTEDETTLYGKWSLGISISKKANRTAKKGGTIQYTIILRNLTTETYSDVKLKDDIPEALSYKENLSNSGISYDSEKKLWTVDSLTAGSERQIVYTVSVPETAESGDTYPGTAKLREFLVKGDTETKVELTDESQYLAMASASTVVKNEDKQISGGDDGNVSAEKTAEWVDSSSIGKKVNIYIEEETTAIELDTPRILFLGTLCSAHTLTKDAVVKSLEAASSYGDVDYYLFSRYYTDLTNNNTVTKGTLAKDTPTEEIEGIVGALISGHHASLYDFADVLQNVDKDDYDFIVMEFDGTRLGYFTAKNGYPNDDDFSNLNRSAAVLKEYYKAGKVAWIIPEKKSGDTYLYDDVNFFDNTYVYVRETLKLTAPEDLNSAGEVDPSKPLTSLTTLKNRVAESDGQIWVYYDNAENVKIFLDRKLGNRVGVSDVVSGGLNISSIVGQYQEIGADKKPTGEWKDIPADKTKSDGTMPDGTMLSYTLTTDEKTGQSTIKAEFNLSEIYPSYYYGDANNVRLKITSDVVQTKISEVFIYNETTGKYELKTNVGEAKVETVGGGVTVEEKEESPDVKTDPVQVKYEYVGKTVPSGKEPPASVNWPKNTLYKCAKEDSAEGYVFTGWYKDDEFKTKYSADGEALTQDVTTLYGKWTYGIGISKAIESPAEPDKMKSGESATYAITLTNKTGSDYTVKKVSDELNEYLKYDKTASEALIQTYTPSNSGQNVYWENVKIPAASGGEDGTVVLRFVATISEDIVADESKDYATIGNVAKVKDAEDKETPSNNVDLKATPRQIKVHYSYKADTPVPEGKTPPTDDTENYGSKYTPTAQSAPGWEFSGWSYKNNTTDVKYDSEKTLDKTNFTALETGNQVDLVGEWSYKVSLEKKASVESAKGGEGFNYTITVKNASSTAITEADSYTVTDVLDSNLVYDKTTGASVSTQTETSGIVAFDETSRTLTVSKLSIPANGSATITVPVKLKSDYSGTAEITNKASGIQGTDANTKKEDTAKINASPRALSIEYKYIGTYKPSSATVPDKVTDAAYGAKYTIEGSSKTTLSNDDKTWYTFDGWYKTNTDGVLSDKVSGEKELTSEEFASLAEGGGTVTLYGKWIPVDSYAVSKDVKYNSTSVKNGRVHAGSTVTYYIDVTNSNTTEARTISFVDKVPAGLTVVENTISDEGALKDGVISWTLTLTAGETKTLSFNASVPTLTELTEYDNKAYVAKVGDDKYTGPGSEENKPGEAKFTGVPTVSVKVTKTWSDTWDSHESETIKINMHKTVEGKECTGWPKAIELTKTETSYEATLDALDEKGKAITYSFKELKGTKELAEGDMNGNYKVSYVTTDESGVKLTTINNVYQIQPSDLSIAKAAVDKETGEQVSKLVKGDEYYYVLTVTNSRTYEAAVNVLVEDAIPSGLTIDESGIVKPEADTVKVNGQKLSWTIASLKYQKDLGAVTSIKIPVTVSSDSDAIEFTNVAKIVAIDETPITDEQKRPTSEKIKTRVRNFTVTKEWYKFGSDTKMSDTSKQPDIYVTLMRSVDGGAAEAVGDSVKLDSGKWTHKWTKLDMYDSNSKVYVYTVKETYKDGKEIEDYDTAIDYSGGASGNTSAVIKNSERSKTVSYQYVGDVPKGVERPADEVKRYGTKYESVEKPSAKGYTFEGWYTDPECTQKYVENTELNDENVPTGTLILYGKWTRIASGTKTRTGDSNRLILYSITLLTAALLTVLMLKKRKKGRF